MLVVHPKDKLKTLFKDCPEAINYDINGRSNVFTQWHNAKYVCIGEPMTLEQAQKVYRSDTNKENTWHKPRNNKEK
tara:strand:+ start:1075 stop:1302 length:228 start_codon:yes stop_codon:yes gene_type:complete